MATVDLTVSDPTLVEAAGPSVTADRMMVLKPFVTTAYKQRVRLCRSGRDAGSRVTSYARDFSAKHFLQ